MKCTTRQRLPLRRRVWKSSSRDVVLTPLTRRLSRSWSDYSHRVSRGGVIRCTRWRSLSPDPQLTKLKAREGERFGRERTSRSPSDSIHDPGARTKDNRDPIADPQSENSCTPAAKRCRCRRAVAAAGSRMLLLPLWQQCAVLTCSGCTTGYGSLNATMFKKINAAYFEEIRLRKCGI